eukprot:CAMPEP_0172492096 /NCGR_PEP_ID=MMETSP1066-20121228/23109_1 /TAXON_ID=671091 /ORGANISM="Coscinodiscus wailesii, Strain CCMP2513" /LENGTH=78 /DNA_ID=CAMNT_0013261519 /DNA_START=8 /DNA_END=241 /DNA_ORIENTATION=-
MASSSSSSLSNCSSVRMTTSVSSPSPPPSSSLSSSYLKDKRVTTDGCNTKTTLLAAVLPSSWSGPLSSHAVRTERSIA